MHREARSSAAATPSVLRRLRATLVLTALPAAAIGTSVSLAHAQGQPATTTPAPSAAPGPLPALSAPAATVTGPVWPQPPPSSYATPQPTAQPGNGAYVPPGYGVPRYGTPVYPQGAAPSGQRPQGAYPYPGWYGYPGTFAGPPSIPYEEGKPAPNGYRLSASPRRGLVVAGASTFGSAYLVTLLAASIVAGEEDDWGDPSDDDDEKKAVPLFIPVVGPFIGISTLDASPVASAWLILDGLAQGAGAAMLIAGLAYPTKRWIRNDLGMQWRVAPIKAGRDGLGMGVLGSF